MKSFPHVQAMGVLGRILKVDMNLNYSDMKSFPHVQGFKNMQQGGPLVDRPRNFDEEGRRIRKQEKKNFSTGENLSVGTSILSLFANLCNILSFDLCLTFTFCEP